MLIEKKVKKRAELMWFCGEGNKRQFGVLIEAETGLQGCWQQE
jgi:hypothetical protein